MMMYIAETGVELIDNKPGAIPARTPSAAFSCLSLRPFFFEPCTLLSTNSRTAADIVAALNSRFRLEGRHYLASTLVSHTSHYITRHRMILTKPVAVSRLL